MADHIVLKKGKRIIIRTENVYLESKDIYTKEGYVLASKEETNNVLLRKGLLSDKELKDHVKSQGMKAVPDEVVEGEKEAVKEPPTEDKPKRKEKQDK